MMTVRLIAYTPDPERVVAAAAKLCYSDSHIPDLLEGLDVLVDGPFVEAQKDLKLRFRGSANQRIIDVPASLAAGEPRLWQETE